MSKSKIKKLAVIRDDDASPCPFGLPITTGCCNVGDAIHRMAPLDSVGEKSKERVKKANGMVYVYHKTGKRCPFADGVMVKFGKVNCDWGDTAQGIKSVPFAGSPIYPQTFSGVGLDGLYGHPGGFYGDNNLSRNMFLGLFSLLGEHDSVDTIVKMADICDEKGDRETADKLDKIIEDIVTADDDGEKENAIKMLEDMLDEYKEKYDEENMNTGMLRELAEKWNMGRQ